MSYDMDREEGEWGLADYVEKGIEVLNNDTGFFMTVEKATRLTGHVMQMMQQLLLQIPLQWIRL